MSGNKHTKMKEDDVRSIELLAPAKDLECGIMAIDHGADAVYIGATYFGARQAAGNDVNDIARLAAYAHKFGTRVYVTVNTIIYEKELSALESLLKELIKARIDAILVQDMAVIKLIEKISKEEEFKNIPLPYLHASTQTDNRCADKVHWLRVNGFTRVVLARELSLNEIRNIHEAEPNVELEAFVHGALCVSYSGACYASQRFFSRSANRGECAQFCRMAFNLIDSNGDTIISDSHLLSLKDMRQIDRIGDLVEAGVCSLKIEGRLKDANYVKNVVAAYSQALDLYISKHKGKYRRSSFGHNKYSFTPDLKKTFNRGFTHYFLDGRKKDISSFETPKAMGEYVGYVKEIRRNSFNVAGTATFANGDGLCFFNKQKKLEGFRVNRVENNRLFPLTMPHNLEAGTALYRNNDMEFERAMSGKTAERKLNVKFYVHIKNDRLAFTAEDECGRNAHYVFEEPLQKALKPQRENIERQLSKLGGTHWKAENVTFEDSSDTFFIPSSILANIRRQLLESLEATPLTEQSLVSALEAKNEKTYDASALNIANVANSMAKNYYPTHGVNNAATAFETGNTDMPLMTCRYCLRYALGYCIKNGGKKPEWKEPLYLEATNGIRVRLLFNCAKCQMEVYDT